MRPADGSPLVPQPARAECAPLSQTPQEDAGGGTLDGRRRSPSEPVPPGADPGAEDGQGQDLLTGDRRVHEHQRDADPARPLGLRQVRQARRRLLGRVAPRRRSARSCGRRGSTTSPSSARGGSGGAIASSPIFAEHGITIAAVFDTDPAKVGTTLGGVPISPLDRLDEIVRDRSIVVGVLAVPAEAAQDAADRLVAAGVKIVFNYSQALIDSPSDVQVHTSNPAVELLYALVLPPRPEPSPPAEQDAQMRESCSGTGTCSAAPARTSTRASSRASGAAPGTT